MFLYRILSILLFPLVYIYLLLRLFNGKEDLSRFKERFGFTKIPRPKKLFWIHCVSVGESNSALILVKKILESNSQTHILFTSTTVTSAAQIKQKLERETRVIHQFLPIDDYFSAKRFVKYWHPELAIFVESEIWPNLIDITAKNKIKLALVNARISEKSAQRWQFFHKIGFNILKKFQIVFAQSITDQKRLIKLGLKNTQYVGNLKSCGEALNFNLAELNNLSHQIKNRKFWLAASTHNGEEEIIIDIHQKLKVIYPDILTIIAPRHPKRLEEIIKIIPKNSNFAIRSKNELITNKTDFYLVDTLGELGLFYKLSDISFIGGSLKKNIGGHTPFEALQLNSVVISGRNVANFSEIYTDLAKDNCCILVKNEEELFESLLTLLKNKKLTESFGISWQKFNRNYQDILPKIVNCLKK